MPRSLAAAALAVALLVPTVFAQAEAPTRTVRLRQTATLTEIPKDAETVSFWVAIPCDGRNQEVLDLRVVDAPGAWTFVKDETHGNDFLRVDVQNPGKSSLDVVVDATVRRRACFSEIDPARVGAITESHRKLFATELDRDAPHMGVSPSLQKRADEICGDTTNVWLQTRKILDFVADYADHYSKDPTKPNCGVGDAGDCLTNAGGCCSDLHALFVALARARGIPARMEMGYRALAKNDGKEVDPGYRCWVEFFIPGYGWQSADIVEADAPKGLGRTRWFSGLTVERIWLYSGRDFELAGRQSTDPIPSLTIGYAEIDGVPARTLPEGDKKAQLSRKVKFDILDPKAPTALGQMR